MFLFKANLIVNPNLQENLPAGTPKEFPESLIKEFKEFLDIPKIKQATEGDTIELKKGKHRGGFALELEFLSDKLQEPFQTGIYTNKKIPDIKPGDLKYWTYMFLCHKKGEKPRFLESSFGMIERVLFNGRKVFRK